jgi:hypothetical protein
MGWAGHVARSGDEKRVHGFGIKTLSDHLENPGVDGG